MQDAFLGQPACVDHLLKRSPRRPVLELARRCRGYREALEQAKRDPKRTGCLRNRARSAEFLDDNAELKGIASNPVVGLSLVGFLQSLCTPIRYLG